MTIRTTMSDHDSSNSMSIPRWDGKQETFPLYRAKVKTFLEYYDCGDALDAVAMRNLPKKAEYDILGTTDDDHIKKVFFYKANKSIYTIIVLGQDSDHGLATM